MQKLRQIRKKKQPNIRHKVVMHPALQLLSHPPITTDFIDTRPSNKNFGEHLAIRFRQSYAPYMVLQECRC